LRRIGYLNNAALLLDEQKIAEMAPLPEILAIFLHLFGASPEFSYELYLLTGDFLFTLTSNPMPVRAEKPTIP
jgi:hypothetical protein